MKPCKVRQAGKAMVCLCHGSKAKWKDGAYCCIATDTDVAAVGWPEFQAFQAKPRALPGGGMRIALPDPPEDLLVPPALDREMVDQAEKVCQMETVLSASVDGYIEDKAAALMRKGRTIEVAMDRARAPSRVKRLPSENK